MTSQSFSKKTLQDYEVLSVIGNGSFGTCYKVRDKDSNRLYAWKTIDYEELDDGKLESLASEINVLRQLRHPNIVQYYHHLNSNETKSIFIIMEWCEGGDLAQLIAKSRVQRKRFQEPYIWRVLLQICNALQACHSKLKQGTVLHRDIKPANIFLDAYGNAKLGDFGLARVVQRGVGFAETFVGTPYYMSPELMKGSRYDSKSDVWAVGCLTYEMATLRPPFKGGKLTQLSLNISKGQYTNISAVYSQDLQESIRLMLQVSNEHRPSIEEVACHPNLKRNLTQIGCNLEALIDAERDFYARDEREAPRTRLEYSFSSAISSTDCTYRADGRRLSVSGVFTPDLRTEMFASVNRRLYSRALQKSDPELYKSNLRFDDDQQTEYLKPLKCPQALTQNVFDKNLQQRLHAIRAHEALLRRKEENLCALEQELNKKEQRLQEFQNKLNKKQASLESKIRILKQSSRRRSSTHANAERMPTSFPAEKRNSMMSSNLKQSASTHDETYCSIEPQDAVSPTVAKLNLADLPTSKALTALRKVTFQSPKQIMTYNAENEPPKIRGQTIIRSSIRLRNSLCSSSDGSNSECTAQRRKSFLSLLGIKRNTKEVPKAAQPVLTDITSHPNIKPVMLKTVLSTTESDKLTNIWTKENKRAAFDLLAAMNAAEANKEAPVSKRSSTALTRQSMREQRRSALCRDQLRKSLKSLTTVL